VAVCTIANRGPSRHRERIVAWKAAFAAGAYKGPGRDWSIRATCLAEAQSAKAETLEI